MSRPPAKNTSRRRDWAMKDLAEVIMRNCLIRTVERSEDPEITLHPEETDFAMNVYKVMSDVEVNDASVQLLENLTPERHDHLHEMIIEQIDARQLSRL